MLREIIENWKGRVVVGGVEYASAGESPLVSMKAGDAIDVTLLPIEAVVAEAKPRTEATVERRETKITVKQYMTRKSTPEFDFMAKWNNDEPMPLRTMVGWVDRETAGMEHWHLRGMALREVTCLRCGRKLSNDVSRLYGVGPECIKKIPAIADLEVDELKAISDGLRETTWEGWVIKSAITKKEEM